MELGSALGVVLGDIAGKGLTAGIWQAHLMGLIQRSARRHTNPAKPLPRSIANCAATTVRLHSLRSSSRELIREPMNSSTATLACQLRCCYATTSPSNGSKREAPCWEP